MHKKILLFVFAAAAALSASFAGAADRETCLQRCSDTHTSCIEDGVYEAYMCDFAYTMCRRSCR